MTAPTDLPPAPARSDERVDFIAKANLFFKGVFDYVAGVKAYALARATAKNAGVVKYGPFSGANYLLQPYNSDLDPGTGDFYIAFWASSTATTGERMCFSRGHYTTVFNGPRVYVTFISGNLRFLISDDAGTTFDLVTSSSLYNDGVMHFVVAQRIGTVITLRVDAQIVGTTTIVEAILSLSNANATVQLGDHQASGIPLDGRLAGVRSGSGSLSAGEVAAIYATESPMFRTSTLYAVAPGFVVPPNCKFMALCGATVETVASSEMVFNSGNPYSATTGYVVGANNTLSISTGFLRATSVASGVYWFYFPVATVIGKRYKAWTRVIENSLPVTAFFRIYDASNALIEDVASTTTTGRLQGDFTATTTETRIVIYATATLAAQFISVDAMNCRIVDNDVTGNDKGFAVYGSVAKVLAAPSPAAAMTLTALPALPVSTSSAATYVASCDAFLAALPLFCQQLNSYVQKTVITTLLTYPVRGASNTALISTVDAYLAALPTFQTQVNAYAGKLGAWTTSGTLLTPRRSLVGAGTQSSGLSVGGDSGVISAATEKYDGAIWTTTGALLTARVELGGAGTQTAALSFGGAGGWASETESFNGTVWTAGGGLLTPRYNLGGAGIQTAALSVGGTTATAFSVVEQYNGSAWTAGPSLPDLLRGATACGNPAAALAFGGSNTTPGIPVKTALEYDGSAWAATGSLVGAARLRLGGAGAMGGGIRGRGGTGWLFCNCRYGRIQRRDVGGRDERGDRPLGASRRGGSGFWRIFRRVDRSY